MIDDGRGTIADEYFFNVVMYISHCSGIHW